MKILMKIVIITVFKNVIPRYQDSSTYIYIGAMNRSRVSDDPIDLNNQSEIISRCYSVKFLRRLQTIRKIV